MGYPYILNLLHFCLHDQRSGVPGVNGGHVQLRVVEVEGSGGGPVWGPHRQFSVLEGLWKFRSVGRLNAHVSLSCRSQNFFHYITGFIHLNTFITLISLQPNVCSHALRAILVRTAVAVFVTATLSTEKSVVWLVSLWQELVWHWPASPR